MEPAPGAINSRYEITGRIGAGGMGVVFKAVDRLLGRSVALKFLPDDTAKNPEALKRFQHEARAASALNHPGICTVYDFGESAGCPFIVMELLEGMPLDRLTAKGALPTDQILSIAVDLLDALHCAHSRGVIHRDVKSPNVFITQSGRAKVLDFGLAKFPLQNAVLDASGAPTAESMTAGGAIAGTVKYMSPEQILGRDLDGRTDLYSAAVVIYEMATGRRPFEGDAWTAVANDIVNRKQPSPLTFNPKLPQKLLDIIATGLEKDRNSRYQTAEEFHNALSRLRHENEIAAMAPAQAGADTGVSIGVLAFADLTPQKDHEYLCDGLAEELINRLSQLTGVRVASRTSAFSLKGKEYDLRTVAAKLGVDKILEGSVRKSGERLRISVQLVDVTNDSQLWSERFDRHFEDVFAIQDEIAESMAKQLKLALAGGSGRGLARRYSDNVEAYSLYLKGLYFWNRRFDGQVGKAIECFEEVIKLDPSHALAWAGIADCYTQIAGYSLLPPRVAYAKALQAAERGLKLDDSVPETTCSMAVVDLWFKWDYRSAEQGFRRALEIHPRFGLARHYLSMCLAYAGRFKEAIEEIRYAQKLEPLSHIINGSAALVLYYARRYDEALDECVRLLEIEPNALLPIFVKGAVHCARENWAAGIAGFEQASALTGDRAFWYALVGYAYSLSGNQVRGRQVIEELLERSASGKEYVDPVLFGWMYCGLRDPDNAFLWFDRAVDEGSCDLMLSKVVPAMDPVRSDPRIESLLQRIGLPPGGGKLLSTVVGAL